MTADLIIQQTGGEPFSWGGRSLTTASELRTEYTRALQAADGDDMTPLIEFARA